VNTLAEGLKTFVNALLDALGAALTFLLDAYQKFINLLFTLLELIAGGLRKILKGLYNLALAAKESPSHFMGQLQEEFLGMNLSDPLPFERSEHPPASYFKPPVEGESDIPEVLMKDSLSANDIDVAAISETFGPELMQDFMTNVSDGGQMEFGGSGDDELEMLKEAYGVEEAKLAALEGEADAGAESYPYAHLADDPQARADAELADFLSNSPTPSGDKASEGNQADTSSVPEEAKIGPFTTAQRFHYVKTMMVKGISDWWQKNQVAIIAGIVAAIVIGVAAIILSGGAVLSLIPPLLQVLGAIFMGAALVKAGQYLKGFLTKAWPGEGGIAAGAKDFARALVIVVVELIFILLFDLNTVLKAAKAGLKGSLKMAAQGAKNTTKALLGAGRKTLVNTGRNTLKVGRGLVNVGAGGTKLTVSGLKNGFSRGVKTVQDLIGRIKSNLSFKKFRIRRQGRWFKLEGKLNPWVLLASGEITQVDNVKGIDGVVLSNTDEATDLVRALQGDEALKTNFSSLVNDLDPSSIDDVIKGLDNVPPGNLAANLKFLDSIKDNPGMLTAWKVSSNTSLGTDVSWLGRIDGWLGDGVSQTKISSLLDELEELTPLKNSVEGQPKTTTTLREAFESGEINIKAWERINDGAPTLKANASKYYHYLQKMSKYANEIDNGGTVKYYRVQTNHPRSKILTVNASDGTMNFNKLDAALNISTDTIEHAEYYFKLKASSKPPYNEPQIIEFEVPKWLDVEIKTSSIPQDGARNNPLNPKGELPKVVDPNQPGDPFELTSYYHELLSMGYVQGSASVIKSSK